MYRLFTLEEATKLIPTVDLHLGEMQTAARDMLELRERLAHLEPGSVAARNLMQEIAFLVGQVHSSKAALDRLGVHVKDVEAGQVDFPSQLGAEVICLTWAKGQDAITHYHRLGENGAKPLPTRLLDAP